MSNTSVVKKHISTQRFEEQCRTYCEIREQIAILEERKKLLQAEIKEEIRASGASIVEIGGYKVTLSEFPKEYFSLKDAKATVPASVWEMLQPFVKINIEERLLVKAKPGVK